MYQRALNKSSAAFSQQVGQPPVLCNVTRWVSKKYILFRWVRIWTLSIGSDIRNGRKSVPRLIPVIFFVSWCELETQRGTGCLEVC
jgi:hypothetical protein